MSESVTALSSTNWWGIIFATVALALFFTGYSAYRYSWEGRQYRKGSAAPSGGHTALGGRSWWRHRIEILPLVVVLCYLGVISSFVDSTWFKILAIWWFGSAVAVTWFLWLGPALASKRQSDINATSDMESTNPQGDGFPGGDEADYVIVSPYEQADSDRRPWWKPRRRE